MQTSLYVGLSAQLALKQRLDTVANNMANVNTPGFRAEEPKFDEVLASGLPSETSFATVGGTYLSQRSGAIVKTENPLDVAVSGNAWLAIRTPTGIAYTRDGRLQMNENGALQTINGQPVLDAGGAPIALDPASGSANIAQDGMITQNGRQVGALGLFAMPPGAKLSRSSNSSVVPDRPATPILDFSHAGVHQGYIEDSNVDGVKEMVHLIRIQREFEDVTSALNGSETSLNDAVKSLATGS